MRLVFLFFVTINVLFFVWQSGSFSGTRKVNPASLTAIPANVDKLVLIKEALSAKNTTTKAPPASAQVTEVQQQITDTSDNKPGESGDELKTAGLLPSLPSQSHTADKYVCFALGPFKEVAMATPIALKLRDLGAITNNRRFEKQVATGFWVYLPQFESWKDARKKVMELESMGMKDMFIMGRGAMKNAVSVGLFTSETAARARMSRLVDLGEKPKMQTQFSNTPEFWIDIDVEAEQKNVVAAIEAIAKGLNLQELVTRNCE